ncbi:MAG TPA: hypothetical protein VI912_02310 [Candidatus Bilamarchaeaceae archaeon]|nr:hypothetical protein [Candidatus Bilamarchaeaceae archaeon]
MATQRIMFIFLQRPQQESTLDEDIAWICKAFGFAEDEHDLATFIFKSIIHSSKNGEGITSKDIADQTHVTQAAIIYHLNSFIRTGLVVKAGRLYKLRAPSLDESFEELEIDLTNRISKMRNVAQRIDEQV